MTSNVQYGFAGNAFEALAVSVNLWGAGDYVPGGPPLTRDNDWSSDGAQHWSGTSIDVEEIFAFKFPEIGPVPFSDQLYVQTNLSSQVYSIEMFDVLGTVSFRRNAVKEEELVINTQRLK